MSQSLNNDVSPTHNHSTNQLAHNTQSTSKPQLHQNSPNHHDLLTSFSTPTTSPYVPPQGQHHGFLSNQGLTDPGLDQGANSQFQNPTNSPPPSQLHHHSSKHPPSRPPFNRTSSFRGGSPGKHQDDEDGQMTIAEDDEQPNSPPNMSSTFHNTQPNSSHHTLPSGNAPSLQHEQMIPHIAELRQRKSVFSSAVSSDASDSESSNSPWSLNAANLLRTKSSMGSFSQSDGKLTLANITEAETGFNPNHSSDTWSNVSNNSRTDSNRSANTPLHSQLDSLKSLSPPHLHLPNAHSFSSAAEQRGSISSSDGFKSGSKGSERDSENPSTTENSRPRRGNTSTRSALLGSTTQSNRDIDQREQKGLFKAQNDEDAGETHRSIGRQKQSGSRPKQVAGGMSESELSDVSDNSESARDSSDKNQPQMTHQDQPNGNSQIPSSTTEDVKRATRRGPARRQNAVDLLLQTNVILPTSSRSSRVGSMRGSLKKLQDPDATANSDKKLEDDGPKDEPTKRRRRAVDQDDESNPLVQLDTDHNVNGEQADLNDSMKSRRSSQIASSATRSRHTTAGSEEDSQRETESEDGAIQQGKHKATFDESPTSTSTSARRRSRATTSTNLENSIEKKNEHSSDEQDGNIDGTVANKNSDSDNEDQSDDNDDDDDDDDDHDDDEEEEEEEEAGAAEGDAEGDAGEGKTKKARRKQPRKRRPRLTLRPTRSQLLARARSKSKQEASKAAAKSPVPTMNDDEDDDDGDDQSGEQSNEAANKRRRRSKKQQETEDQSEYSDDDEEYQEDLSAAEKALAQTGDNPTRNRRKKTHITDNSSEKAANEGDKPKRRRRKANSEPATTTGDSTKTPTKRGRKKQPISEFNSAAPQAAQDDSFHSSDIDEEGERSQKSDETKPKAQRRRRAKSSQQLQANSNPAQAGNNTGDAQSSVSAGISAGDKTSARRGPQSASRVPTSQMTGKTMVLDEDDDKLLFKGDFVTSLDVKYKLLDHFGRGKNLQDLPQSKATLEASLDTMTPYDHYRTYDMLYRHAKSKESSTPTAEDEAKANSTRRRWKRGDASDDEDGNVSLKSSVPGSTPPDQQLFETVYPSIYREVVNRQNQPFNGKKGSKMNDCDEEENPQTQARFAKQNRRSMAEKIHADIASTHTVQTLPPLSTVYQYQIWLQRQSYIDLQNASTSLKHTLLADNFDSEVTQHGKTVMKNILQKGGNYSKPLSSANNIDSHGLTMGDEDAHVELNDFGERIEPIDQANRPVLSPDPMQQEHYAYLSAIHEYLTVHKQQQLIKQHISALEQHVVAKQQQQLFPQQLALEQQQQQQQRMQGDEDDKKGIEEEYDLQIQSAIPIREIPPLFPTLNRSRFNPLTSPQSIDTARQSQQYLNSTTSLPSARSQGLLEPRQLSKNKDAQLFNYNPFDPFQTLPPQNLSQSEQLAQQQKLKTLAGFEHNMNQMRLGPLTQQHYQVYRNAHESNINHAYLRLLDQYQSLYGQYISEYERNQRLQNNYMSLLNEYQLLQQQFHTNSILTNRLLMTQPKNLTIDDMHILDYSNKKFIGTEDRETAIVAHNADSIRRNVQKGFLAADVITTRAFNTHLYHSKGAMGELLTDYVPKKQRVENRAQNDQSDESTNTKTKPNTQQDDTSERGTSVAKKDQAELSKDSLTQQPQCTTHTTTKPTIAQDIEVSPQAGDSEAPITPTPTQPQVHFVDDTNVRPLVFSHSRDDPKATFHVDGNGNIQLDFN